MTENGEMVGTIAPDALADISNIPMLVAWVKKHAGAEEHSLTAALIYLLTHAHTGPACRAISKHLSVAYLRRLIALFPSNERIALLVASLLRRLLDCNLTRDELVASPEPVRLCRELLAALDGRALVEQVLPALHMCCFSQTCRREMLAPEYYALLKGCTQRHSSSAVVVRAALKCLNGMCAREADLEALYRLGAVGLCLKCMSRHRGAAQVVLPGMQFLCRASSAIPEAIAYLLSKRAVPLLLRALQLLAGDDGVLLQGLRLVRVLSQTQQGAAQIEAVPGGWQTLGYGSELGNDLVHDLQGHFQNRGWSVGESGFVPVREEQALRDAAIAGARARSGVQWSQRTLAEYMKTDAGTQRLAINREYEAVQFEMLSSLDLLPAPREAREDWFIRLRRFEAEGGAQVDALVRAMLDIRRREAAGGPAEQAEPVPIFVRGERVTAETLDMQDVSAEDRLRGVNNADDTSTTS